MSEVIGTIITDCHDDPTRSRQEVRFRGRAAAEYGLAIGSPVQFVNKPVNK